MYTACKNDLDKIFHSATSDKSAELEILVYGKLGVRTKQLAYPREEVCGSTRSKNAMFAIENLVKKGSIRLPDFIKVDAESHVAKAIEGIKESIRKARPNVIFNIHCPEESLAAREHIKNYTCRKCITGEKMA